MSSFSSIDSDLAGFLIQKFKSSLESARSSHGSDPKFETFQNIIERSEDVLSGENVTSRIGEIIAFLYELNGALSQWLIHHKGNKLGINNIFSLHAAQHRLDARELRRRYYDSIPEPSPKKREPNFDLDRFTFFEPGSSSSPTVGFQDHSHHKIVGWLTDASSGEGFKAVGVYGIGGSGKTTLVKQVLENEKVKEKFKGNIIWVCLSHLTSLHEVDISILKYMLNYLDDDLDIDRLTDDKDKNEDWLISQLKEKLLKLKNYVIVFDDLWHCNEWISEFYNKVAEDNAAIIVTSRKEEVVRKLVSGKKNTDNKGGNMIHLDPWKYMDNNSDFIKDIENLVKDYDEKERKKSQNKNLVKDYDEKERKKSQNKNLVNDDDKKEIISRCHGLALAANKLLQMMIQYKYSDEYREENRAGQENKQGTAK